MTSVITHDIDFCECFDCRMRRKEEAEDLQRFLEDEKKAKAEADAYIRRRGGLPHKPNSKLNSHD